MKNKYKLIVNILVVSSAMTSCYNPQSGSVVAHPKRWCLAESTNHYESLPDDFDGGLPYDVSLILNGEITRSHEPVYDENEPRGARVIESFESFNILEFVKQFEGCHLKAYFDAKQYSIGYGTKAKHKNEVINQEEAERRFLYEMDMHRRSVLNLADNYGYKFNAHEIDALISFNYNTGCFSKLCKDGQRSKAEITKMMLYYNKADMKDGRGLRPLEGLTRRREAEQRLFKYGYKSVL